MKIINLPNNNLKITDSRMLYDYIRGGKAELTLIGPAGTAHTYLFMSPRSADEFPPDIRFVYVLHDDKRFYIGMIEQNTFRCTARSRFNEDAETVKGAKYIVRLANNQLLLSTTPMKLYQSGRCARCGRLLDSESGIRRGFGKKCWSAYQIKQEAEEKLYADFRSTTVQ